MTVNIKIKNVKALEGLPRYVYVLAVIAILGLSAGLYRLIAGLGATTHLSNAYPWGVWISFDLTTVAFAGAAFTLSMLVYIFHMHDLHAAVRPTVLFGLLGYSSVLVILFFDLGRFDRFWHFLVYYNLTSALFEVSWCIAIYSAILFYEFSPVILDRFKNEKLSKFVKSITIGMVIAGITLSSMHQSSLGSLFVIQIHRLHPLWYSMMQPEFFLISSMAAGIALIIIASYASIWMFKQTVSEDILEKLGRIIPWILVPYLLLKIIDLVINHKMGLLFSSGGLSLLYLSELLLTLAAIIWFSIKKLRATRKNALYGALIVAAGIILNRFDVTWFAMKHINGATYFPSLVELALVTGVLSGVVVVYALLAHFFPVFSETLPVEALPRQERIALNLSTDE